MAWYDDPEEIRRATAEALGVSVGVEEPETTEEPNLGPRLSLGTAVPDESRALEVETKQWWEDPDAVEAVMKEVGVGVAAPMRSERSLTEEFGAGLARGTDQTQGLLYGFSGLLGQAIGVEDLEQFGLENYARKMEEAAKNQASIQDPTEDIDGLGDFGLYAAGIISEQIPQLLLSLGGAGLGGAAAKTAAERIIANEVAKRTAAGMAKKEAAKEVAQLVAQNALTAAGTAAKRGAVGGAYLANFGQIAGGSFGQMAQELGEGNAAQAVAFAAPGAALDTLGEVFVAGKFLKPFTKAQRAAVEGVKPLTIGRIGGGLAGGVASGSAVEGPTEYIQTGLEQAALGSADPNRTVGDVVMTPEAERERQIAAAAGATVGGLLGGAGGVVEVAFSPRTTEALRQKRQQQQTGTGVPPEQGQEQQQETPADEEWSEPVTIASRNKDYEGLEYRQNKAGQVWAFNVPEVSRFGAFAIPTKYGQGVLLNPAFEGASEIRSEVKARLAEMADPEAFKAPPVTPPKKVEENLEDADLVEGEEVAANAEAIAAAAERRRQRDQEILTRDLESAAATLARPQEDAKGFVDSLKEGDQVSVLTEDGEGNAYSIPMTFVRLNQNGQAQLRSEPDEDNNVVTRLYDQDEFNRITTRPADQVAPAATTTGTGVKVSPLTAPIRPAAEGEQLSEAERAQNLLYFKDVEGRKIDDNLWINSARELGVEITPETTGAVAEQEIRNRFGVERTTTKQDDPASQVLMDALGPNPTKQRLESVTGTRWTGKGSKFTWMLPDKLGGDGIPVTTRLFNRKAPAEALPMPQRSTTSGFKPEEQGGTAPAAPDIQTTGPDLIAKSSAEFVGVRRGENNELVTARPTRGQDNATYLQEVDTAADLTIRQMNYLGQPVLVTPETAQSLAEANQFWIEHEQRQKAGTARKDRQPVRFYTQERSDKDGNRNTYITGVTYEGRTYRTGKTPDDFSVDRPLTTRGSKSRRRGRGIYDAIRIASPSRIARSEAGMAGAKTKAGEGPLAKALRGVRGRAAIAELNEAENSLYSFFAEKVTNPILNIEDPAVTTEVRDLALEAAQDKVAVAFLKAKKANPSQKTKVLPGRQRTIGEKVYEKLQAYQEAKRGLAIQALRDKFRALSEKAVKAKAGARGTGTAKALKMSPDGAINLITRARRGQKAGIPEAKRTTRDDAMTELQELVDFGALDQEKKDAQIKRILDKAEKFTEVDRDFMAEQIISELAEADKALAAQQGRKYSRSTAEVAQERRLILSTFALLDSPNIRSLNPFNIGSSALNAAKRTVTRQGMTRETVSFDDETQGVGDEVALKTIQPDDTGRVDQAKLAEKGRPLGVQDAEGGDVAPFTNNIEEALNLMDELPDSDRDLFLRYAEMEIERQGGGRSQTKQPLSEVDRLWAGRIKSYLDGNINRSQLEYFRNEERRLVERTTPRATPAELANLRRGVSTEAALSGVAESRAARTPDAAPTGRAERVVGSPADPAGTVPQRTAGQTGGRGVQPTPRRTRAVAAAAQRDFAGALLGLNEAETAALPQGVVDRVYQSYLSSFDGVLAEQGNNPLTASAVPAADTVTADGKKMFERFAAARLNPDQQRAAIIRSNMAQAYRAGLFDDDPVVSAINKIAADKTQPMNLRLMAKEFAKNAKRGVRFDRVVLDIGRFTKPGNTQTTWAGLFSLTPEGAPVVSVNLDNLHDKDSVPLTFLHELQHVVIRDKVRRAIPLTRTEEQALARLEDLRSQAVIAAARQQGIEVGATPDVNALAERLYALTDPNNVQSGAAVDNRRLAGLVNLEEFVIEMIGNPDMVRLLSELGFGEARTDGKRFSLTGALRNAWNAVVELLTGVKVDPTSPLAMAFKDSWTVNFGTSRNPNITEIKASKRLADRQQAQTRQQYVEGEIEARDLAGTTRDRNRINREFNRIQSRFDRSGTVIDYTPPEAEGPMRGTVTGKDDQGNLLVDFGRTRSEAIIEERTGIEGVVNEVATGTRQVPRIETIPQENFDSIRVVPDQAATEQGSRDKVQVAESRAVDPNDLIQIGRLVRVTARDANGTKFRFFARPGTDSTMMGAPIRVFQETDKDGSTVNRTRVVQADLIESEQPLAMSKTYGEWVPAPVRSAESRAVSPIRPLREGASKQLDDLAWAQRGAPERAMQDVQSYFAGILDGVVENAGDLMHRVYKDNENDTAGFGMAENKVDRVLRILSPRANRNMMSFEQEIESNIRDNASYENIPENEYRAEIDRRLQAYADAHAALQAQNDAQRTIRQIAVDIGNKRWSSAVAGLQKLKSRMGSPQEWREYAFEGFLEGQTPQVAESRAVRRVTPQQDADYLAAVERGDMETAQRMVLIAAKNAGYNIEAWHGTPSEPFYTFDKNRLGGNTGAKSAKLAFFFADDPEISLAYLLNDATPEDLQDPGSRNEYFDRVKTVIRDGLVYKALVKNGKVDRQLIEQFEREYKERNLGKSILSDIGNIAYIESNRWDEAILPSGKLAYDVLSKTFTEEEKAIWNAADSRNPEIKLDALRRAPRLPGYPFAALLRQTELMVEASTGRTYKQIANNTSREGMMHVMLRLQNPAKHDDKGSDYREQSYTDRLIKASEAGKDGVIIANTQDPYLGTVYAVFDPNQIKSADPVTRDAQGNVIPLSERFNEASPDIRFSRAVRRPFASDTATTYNGKTYTRPGLIFGENANLDPRAQELVAILKRAKKAAEQYANLKGEELNRLVRKYYKNQPVPTDLINDALGNLDNPLTDQQFDEIKRLELSDPEAAVKQRIAYLSENRARFRTERQAPALLALPEELAEFLRKIGDGTPDSPGDLRKLQQQALDLGIPKGDMATAFSENLGIYLTRSYNAFIDQEGWERTLRAEDAALGEQSRMGQFRNQIRATLIGQRADELQTDAMAQGRTLSRAEAERQAKEGTTTEEVDQMLESYIAYTKEEASSESFSGLRLPGRQNIKSLEQRKMLSDALREFYGQVENPAVNFVTSYAKLSSLIANHKFQTDLKNLGLKEGWLWDQERNIGQRPPAGYERIAADNDKSLKVLAGLYARSDLVRGLRETFPPNSMEAAQWWLHPFMKLTGLSMGMKTVGSMVSQIRNYLSSYAPIIAGGNMTIADFFRPEWRKNWKEAHGVSIANVFRNYKGDREAITKRIKRLYELGVMGESLTVGLLNDLTRLGKDASISDEQFFNNFEKILKKPGRRIWNAAKQSWEKAEQVYGMTDDIFKVLTYLSEFDKYQKVYPNMPEADLERKAADIARDIHWTYSKAPAMVNELKKFPFIAPFITFTTETIRITLNLGKLTINERKEGQRLREQGLRENNAELVRQGDELLKMSHKRMRGMAAVAFGPWAIGTLAATSLGFSGDDEEDLRQFLPDWQKNSQIIILGKNGSEVRYIDVSYLDPYEVWKKPVVAFMRGLGRAENVEEFFTEAVVGAALEASRPFTSEQILSGAIMDVMRNRDANGRQVYNPQDSGTAIAAAVGSKLGSAFTPGTADTIGRIYKASTGQMSETGRAYEPLNEWSSLLLGQRVSAVDAEQALGFKASQFLRARRDARSIFNRDYLSRGSRSESDVISAYQRSNAGLRDVTAQLRREYIAALNLGVSPAKARSIIRAAGLDRESARMVSTGIYRRLTPSEEQDRMAAPDRKRAARQAIAETPQREVLFP